MVIAFQLFKVLIIDSKLFTEQSIYRTKTNIYIEISKIYEKIKCNSYFKICGLVILCKAH